MPAANPSPPTLTDLLFEDSRAGRCLVAPDGKVLRANAEWLRATGFTLDQVAGQDIVELFPSMRALAVQLHARAREGHRANVPRHHQLINGRDTWWEGSVEPVPMDGGIGLLITAQDVTAQALQEQAPHRDLLTAVVENNGACVAVLTGPELQALRASTALLEAISNTSTDVIYAKDRAGRLQFANPATLALIGKRLDEVLGRTDAEFLSDQQAAHEVMANDRRIMDRGVAEEVEERVPLPDGTERIWLSRKTPYRDHSGEVIGLLGISRDITDRQRARYDLLASEERYRSLFTNMREGFALGEALCDDQGTPRDFRFLEMNDAFEVQSGLSREAARGRPMREVLPQLEQSWIDTYCDVALGGPSRKFESYNRDLDRHFGVHCFSPAPGRFAILFSDITERKRSDEALREANARLRDADRRKDEFLAMLAHELRNPLASIRNSSFVLRHAAPTSDQSRRSQEVIERQTHHLARLVDELLDVTRIARGKIELRRQRIDLRELVGRAADDIRFRMDERGITFHHALPDHCLWADADPTRLAQVIGNLLHNAWKFTGRGEEVALSLTTRNGYGEIRVRDSGTGIDPELLPRVFEPFVQAGQSLARTQGGLGLGLALVKGIVELHQGSVHAESGGPGHGAEFVVRIPLMSDAVEAPRVARTPSPAVAGGGRRVLIVDDNHDAAESLAEVVRMLGHEVEVAFDGPSAIERARANAPDVVLCDIGLPGMSGYEVARELRAEGRPMQLLAVSGYTQPEDVGRAVQAGFDAFVAKPPDLEQLERLLG